MRTPLKTIAPSFVLASLVAVAAVGGASMSTAGCGGGGGSGGTGGTIDPATVCFDYSKFDGTTPAASFKTDVLPIFQRSCGLSDSCHGNESVPKKEQPYLGPNLKNTATDMQIQEVLAGIVGQVSFYDPKMSIVEAGDPEHSFLMYLLDGQTLCSKLTCAEADDCAELMPRGAAEPLKDTERDGIRRWIAQGAKNN